MNEPTRTRYGAAEWGALIGGLLIGWRTWRWLIPSRGDPLGIILTIWWTFLAVTLGAVVVYGALKVTAAFGHLFAEGWRRGQARETWLERRARERQP